MRLKTTLRIFSYAVVLCGFAALGISGTFGLSETGVFIAAIIAAWFAEGTRWQIPERTGTALIVLALPVYYLGWNFGYFGSHASAGALPGILARLILSLTAIKLFQKKSHRDWVFLYLMAFFEILLAAGLSISAIYFGVFLLYAFLMVCVIVLSEIKRTDRRIAKKDSALSSSKPVDRLAAFRVRRIPVLAMILLTGILILAGPLFFLLPRVGSASGGGRAGGVTAMSGFSDSVRLGNIGRIQENEEVVMRARIENPDANIEFFRWRGLALDTFDNRAWSRSQPEKQSFTRGTRDTAIVDRMTSRDNLVLQTIYLEPLDTNVLFGLPRVVGVQSNFPLIFRDLQGGLSGPGSGRRITYRALSDTSRPHVQLLRRDNSPYSSADFRYLQLPDDIDPRIAELAGSLVNNTRNRYEAASGVERYLQTEFGYSLEQRAGGEQPLADFLFNIREGHCEYFATAMAVMLRTQGIATRIVNGFQRGEYNETADVYIVRQKNAHSWVEVYFSETDAWVPFDPTPVVGQNLTATNSGVTARINRYLEALEMIWIQYFVAFDIQEQRSLFTSIKRGLSDYNARATGYTERIQIEFAEWWRQL
ncbi:MAG: DUF3488 and transglutaminase-like domain-containing protein, partial [Acidobacteria bacterium]|nr:DUF3488 and transglutaminase-like domain-containing protein [Acidobacteriota bacterium]MCA1608493.1 DUF3488 and transglutaminase-like domain-containing protein [Acidobacteriota bacterium]